ncbi:hypothetical protein, partial [uncultured Akkermansia sp.]|uniref:hypothetical protein n=1 Tax=uncultured Akkermansia sp. TaxID=512294 RepID=UPI002673BF30
MKNRIPLPLVFCFCISGLFQAVEADMPGKNMELYQRLHRWLGGSKTSYIRSGLLHPRSDPLKIFRKFFKNFQKFSKKFQKCSKKF